MASLSFKPGGKVDVRVMGGMADVQRTGRIPRGIVDAVNWSFRGLVKIVKFPLVPLLLPF